MNSLLILCSIVLAALEPLSPVDGKTVALVPDAQKQVMAPEKLADRIRLLQDDRKGAKTLKHDKLWRRANPLVLAVRTTAGEKGPWKVLIGKKPDLSDARRFYVSSAKIDEATGREVSGDGSVTQAVARIKVPRANLEVATRYYWKAVCRGSCGFGCHPAHSCKNCKVLVETPVSSFVTEDLAPRWIEIEGRVENFRDLGGRIGFGGRRVRQGLVYRGQGLNDNSVTGEEPGDNRLTVGDVRYLTGTLGIRTDLDLRGIGEVSTMKESPLGASVTFVNRSSGCYRGIFEERWKKTMAENFRLFCDRANYPVYFHCIGGADRTGSLAYVMQGVLGVSRHEAETDWESTFYPRIPDENPDPGHWCRESHYDAGLARFGDADTSWNDRVVLYLKSCGITDDEIATFREIMLEK